MDRGEYKEGASGLRKKKYFWLVKSDKASVTTCSLISRISYTSLPALLSHCTYLFQFYLPKMQCKPHAHFLLPSVLGEGLFTLPSMTLNYMIPI